LIMWFPRIALFAALLTCFGAGSVSAQTFTDGLEALQSGDADKAFVIWKPLADQNDAQAQYGLALLLETGGRTFGKNEEEAAELYSKAAEAGVVLAKTNLGLLYAEGRGVRQDPSKAARFWAEAAEAGHHMAQFNLGLSYYTGKGVNQDVDKAVDLIEQAAFSDLPEAQFAMAQFYKLGIGVTKDEAYALSWYEKAGEKGNKDARRYARSLKDKGIVAATIAAPEKLDETRMMQADAAGETPVSNDTASNDSTSSTEPKPEEKSVLLVDKPEPGTAVEASDAGTASFSIDSSAVDKEAEARQKEIERQQKLREQAKAEAEGQTTTPASSSGGDAPLLTIREFSPPAMLDLDEVYPQPVLIGQLPPLVKTPKGAAIATAQPSNASGGSVGTTQSTTGNQPQDNTPATDVATAAALPVQSADAAPGAPIIMNDVEIPDGAFFVWLGTETSKSKAENRWNKLLEKEQRILPNLQPGLFKTKVGGRNAYRVFAGPLPDKALAWKICNAMKATDPYFFCKAWAF
jgi:TPR repeat protein